MGHSGVSISDKFNVSSMMTWRVFHSAALDFYVRVFPSIFDLMVYLQSAAPELGPGPIPSIEVLTLHQERGRNRDEWLTQPFLDLVSCSPKACCNWLSTHQGELITTGFLLFPMTWEPCYLVPCPLQFEQVGIM